jgi:aspartyl-tRNA synthetase
MHRTHTCGELRASNVGETVTLAGWVKSVRHHGEFFFIDLHDRYGTTQLIANQEYDGLEDVPRESVIKVEGEVQEKPEPNEDLQTGDVEVNVETYDVLTEADPLPIDDEATLESKLEYRYLDLRHDTEKLEFRHEFSQAVRDFLDERDFLDVETPLLVRATPEGARDYIVPSRVHEGSAYALPQSPQLYKQLLMLSGVDKYYQFAKCLRDEDLRSDRQPEFTQIDMEMSFVEEDDVLEVTEDMVKHAVKESMGKELDDFPRITFDEAMRRYGSDKPDIRFGHELIDITEEAQGSAFNVINNADYTGAVVAPEALSRSAIDDYERVAKDAGANGLLYMKRTESGVTGPLTSHVETDAFVNALSLEEGETALIVAGREQRAQEALGHLRLKIRDEYDLTDPDNHAFVWVVDFPLFEWDEDGGWTPAHHIFTMPDEDHIDSFADDPANTLSQSYDLALNGVELGSGSIRVSDPELQRELLEFIGVDREEAEEKFGFLLDAYQYGAPIHGGIALGVERICALLTGKNDIREVIAFPKNQQARNPMDGSPTPIDKDVLDELGLRVDDDRQ